MPPSSSKLCVSGATAPGYFTDAQHKLVRAGGSKRLFAGKPSSGVPPTTDAAGPCVADDVGMPSIWITVAVALGVLNVWLIIPGVEALLGAGQWSAARQRAPIS